MFVLDFIRFCRGTVDFTTTGGYPERLVSLCGKKNIPLWKLRRHGEAITATTTRAGGKKLRLSAARAGVTVVWGKEHGIPTLAVRYRLRTGVFVGIFLLLLLPMLLGSFLWRVVITGNTVIPTYNLRQSLEGLGVRAGTRRSPIDTLEVERRMILSDPRLVWISVNLRGSTAWVEVRERELPPPLVDKTTPTNIIAAKSGTITHMEVYDGQPQVRLGDSVLEGDILVSGILENGRQQNRTIHARAKIEAEITDSLAVTVPYCRTVYGYRGLSVHRSIWLFGQRLPLGRQTPPQKPWKLETAEETIPVLGRFFSVPAVRQNYILLEEATEEITPDDARREAEEKLALLEKQQFPPGSILTREVTGQELDDSFILFADYCRIAPISLEKEILLAETPPESVAKNPNHMPE